MFHDKYVDSKTAISGIDCFLVVNGKKLSFNKFYEKSQDIFKYSFPVKKIKSVVKKNVCHGSLMPWRLPSSS